MFNVDNNVYEKIDTEFNTNELIIKLDKGILVEKPIRPKRRNPVCQKVSPIEDCEFKTYKVIFEIY